MNARSYATRGETRGSEQLRALRCLSLAGVSLLLQASSVHAQTSDLLRQGPWTVEAPVGGCGSLPLLQVKGPGTLLDAPNSAALSTLEEALAIPFGKLCPGVSEMILVNGRSRKLIRIKPQAPGPAPMAAPPAAQNSSTPAAAGSAIPLIPPLGSPPPVLPLRSSLPGLSSAHGEQAKCDLLFRWLELGKTSAPAHRAGVLLPPQMMDIFRDETMSAIFGKNYDTLDNGARIELSEKVFAPCTGEVRRTSARSPVSRRPFEIGGVNVGSIRFGEPDRPLPPEYRQEFAQYAELIHEAFAGSPGRFEPAAINQFLQKIREQIQWANAATATASAAPPTLDAFRLIEESENETAGKTAMLRADERDLVRAYLARRQSDLAPAVVQGWLATVSTAPKTLDSANALLNTHRQMAGVFRSLNEQQRSAAEAELGRTLDSEIAPALQVDTAKLTALQPNWRGAQQLASQESEFLSRFGQFLESASYTAALAQFDAARTRIYPAVLPEWRRKVASAQLESGEITALRDQLKTLFVSPADRSLALFQQFEQPVRDRQAQLDAHVAEDERRRLAEAERTAKAEALKSASPTSSGRTRPVSSVNGDVAFANGSVPGSLKTGTGPTGKILNAIYEGDFEKIDLDRSSTDFAAIGGGYVEGFSASCFNDLPRNRIQIMRTVCDEYWVTRNGWGVELSRSCISSHEEGTGVFADPELYAALHSTPMQAVGSAFRTVLDALTTGGNPLTAPITMAANLIQMQSDAQTMVAQNGCTSPALKRFQQNLQLFALGKEGIRRDGTVKLGVALLPPTAGTKYRDSDYARMLDDMVTEQGKTWALNRYIPGSINSVTVSSRDPVGRPAKISAGYAFNGLSAREVGSVTLAFEEGRPSCLYFSDQPNSCRTPAHRITAAYVQGEYR